MRLELPFRFTTAPFRGALGPGLAFEEQAVITLHDDLNQQVSSEEPRV